MEKNCLELSADLWNEFMNLEDKHEDDIRDVRFHIHAIQNILKARMYKDVTKMTINGSDLVAVLNMSKSRSRPSTDTSKLR